MNKYEMGDRVRIVGGPHAGMEGTVCGRGWETRNGVQVRHVWVELVLEDGFPPKIAREYYLDELERVEPDHAADAADAARDMDRAEQMLEGQR